MSWKTPECYLDAVILTKKVWYEIYKKKYTSKEQSSYFCYIKDMPEECPLCVFFVFCEHGCFLPHGTAIMHDCHLFRKWNYGKDNTAAKEIWKLCCKEERIVREYISNQKMESK